MSSSILIPVLICSVLQFDLICSRSPFHPCGSSNTPTAGPACFLYYDCTFPGKKNLVACPRYYVFDGKTCIYNSSEWIGCLMNLNTNVNMSLLVIDLNNYMMPRDSGMINNILKTAENLSKFQYSDSNPCSEDCKRIYNVSLCIIPYDNCTGYYNCSNSLSKFNNCPFNKMFDEFKKQCVTRAYASCGVGSSFPAEGNVNRKLRFCTESQINECFLSESPVYNCVYSTKCMVYEDCSLSKMKRYVNCSEQHNNSICNILFPKNCEKLPELLDEITNGVSISTEKFDFKEGDKAEFTCDSNLTSIERFVWYINNQKVNESERIKILSGRNKSVLSVSNMLVRDTGLLLCTVEYGKDFFQQDLINILVYPLPLVTISPSSQTFVKGINSSTQFTCNVTWSTFYLDKPIEIKWFVNGTQVSSSAYTEVSRQNLTLNESSTVKCGVNMLQTGLTFSQTSHVSFLTNDDIPVTNCKFETVNGLRWASTKPGENFTHPCPSLSSGKLVRSCLIGGNWGEINEDECFGVKLNQISDLLDGLSSVTANSTKSLKLAQLTQQLPNVSNTSNKVILKNVSSILYRISTMRKSCVDENDEAKMETQNVLNSMVEVVQSKVWSNNSSMRLSSLELIETLNVYSSHLWNDKTFAYSFLANKLEFERSFIKTHGNENIFNKSNKLHENQIKVFNKQDQLFDRNLTIPIGASLMQNVAGALMGDNNSSRINSDLISLDVMTPIHDQLVTQFTIQHLQVLPGFSPHCVFWFFNDTLDGYWSSDGCRLKERNETHTTCECSHLTNFAILFSPSAADEKHNMILGIISMVGCIISIVALFLTMVLYAFKWRVLKSKRAVLLVSLCVALIIANIIFLAGVDRTSDPGGCTAVSALLHYFFLASFFMMLMLALHLFISVFFVFFTITKKHVTIMIASGWLLPLFIVSISLAATKMRGYGSEKNCWLSLEFGVLWAFVGPALVIIITNMTIAVSVLIKICQMKISRINMKRSKWLSAAQNLVILNPILGLTWIFGVLSVDKELVVFQYIFAIVNSLQGLFIFLLHGVCLKKSLSTHTKKLKDDKRSPEKFSTSKTRIPVQDTSKMKSDEYHILNSGVSSEAYKPSNIASYSSSTDNCRSSLLSLPPGEEIFLLLQASSEGKTFCQALADDKGVDDSWKCCSDIGLSIA